MEEDKANGVEGVHEGAAGEPMSVDNPEVVAA